MTINSTSSTNSSSSAYTTATSSKRLSGIISGLDTDSIVAQLTMGTQSKIDKQMQNKQVAQWQQDSYREVIKALSEFEDKYFSSSTSSSNILSSSFFNSTSIKNTSTLLNLSGSASAAKNMVVTGISQLAKQAKLSSSYQVSNQKITTGTVQDEWTQSTISGGSITINYGGKDYNVYLDDDFSFNQGDNISKLTDQLNKQISKTDGLKGNVEFSYDAESGKVTLAKTGTATGGIGITAGSSALLSGLGLEAASDNKATSILGTQAANSDYFFNHSIAAGSSLDFKIGDNTYTLKLASAINIPVGASDTDIATVLQKALTKEISNNTDLKDKLNVSVGSDGAVQFSLKDGVSGPLDITGGSQNLLQGFGLSFDSAAKTYSTSGTVNQTDLLQSYLQDSLAGSTLTFSLNGLTKSINFSESEKDQYSTVDGLETYLQTKLNAAYGTGKVTVDNTDGALSFKATSDPTSVLTLTGSSKSGVLGMNGALRVYAGESNRINTNKTLEDLSPNLSTALSTDDPDGSYIINVNGKDFTFKKTDSLDTVINTINNDADANVTLTYSSTTNTFSATAKSGGSSGEVEITDKTGNLATALFGGNVDESTAGYSGGQDAILSVSFDGDPNDAVTITRSDNTFTLDGVNFELLGTNTTTDADGNPVPTDNPITFSTENETDDLYKKISDFITDYNNIISLAYGKYTESNKTDGESYAPLTDAQKKEMSESQITSWETNAKKGLLQNDSLLYNLTLNMRSAMNDQVSSMKSALYEIGITTKSDDYSTTNGQLTIDEDKLKDALTNNPDKVAALFTSSDGIATKLKDVIDSNISTSSANPGILFQKAGSDSSTADNSLLAKSIQENNDQITSLKSLLEDQQNYYYNKFTQLEQYMSQMNSQASFFTSNSSNS
jgi:Flagellar capping protein